MDQRLVFLVEVAALLLGQVEVAVHLFPDPYRHPEEGPHRRMAIGESARSGVGGDVLQAQRARVGDQLAEQAAAFRPVMDPGDLRLIQANRDELGQPAALADDAQRAVTSRHQLDRRLDDMPEHDLEFQMTADGDHGLQQRVRPVPGVEDRLQPQLQLYEEVVEPQVRQQRVGLLALHRLPLHITRVPRHDRTRANGPAESPPGRSVWPSRPVKAARPSAPRAPVGLRSPAAHRTSRTTAAFITPGASRTSGPRPAD